MSSAPLPPQRVPTLTEVVAWPASSPAPLLPLSSAEAQSFEQADAGPPPAPPMPIPGPLPLPLPAMNEEQLILRVLAELQRQVDLMLDYRLREMLLPVFTRATDNLIREARGELASTLRDLVARAVAQELARHRTR